MQLVILIGFTLVHLLHCWTEWMTHKWYIIH